MSQAERKPRGPQAAPDPDQPEIPDISQREDETAFDWQDRVTDTIKDYIGGAKVSDADRESYYLLSPEQKARLSMKLPKGAIGEVTTSTGEVLRFVPAAIVDYLAMIILRDQWSSEIVSVECVYQGPDSPQHAKAQNLILRHAARVRVTVRNQDGGIQTHEGAALASASAPIGDLEAMESAWNISYTGAVTRARRAAISLFGEVFGGILVRDREDRIKQIRAEQKARSQPVRHEEIRPPEPPADSEPAAKVRTLPRHNAGDGLQRPASRLKSTDAEPQSSPEPTAPDRAGPDKASPDKADNADPADKAPADKAPAAAATASARANTPGAPAQGTGDTAADAPNTTGDAAGENAKADAPAETGQETTQPDDTGRLTLYGADGRKAMSCDAPAFEKAFLSRLEALAYSDDIDDLGAANIEPLATLPADARKRIDDAIEQRYVELMGCDRPAPDDDASDATSDATSGATSDAGSAPQSSTDVPADDLASAPADAPADAGTAAKTGGRGDKAARKPAAVRPEHSSESPWPATGLPDVPSVDDDRNRYQSAVIKAIHHAPDVARLDDLEAREAGTIPKLSKSGQKVIATCFKTRRRDLGGDT